LSSLESSSIRRGIKSGVLRDYNCGFLDRGGRFALLIEVVEDSTRVAALMTLVLVFNVSGRSGVDRLVGCDLFRWGFR